MFIRHALLLVVLALCVCGCGDGDGPAPADPAALLVEGLELPVVTRYGATPPLDERVTIAVEADGTVWVGTQETTPEALAVVLRKYLGPRPGTHDEDGVEDEEILEETEEIVESEEGRVPDDGASTDPKQRVVELPPRDPEPRHDAVPRSPFVRARDVLLQIDRRVPFVLIERLLWACADTDVGLSRLFIAVRAARSEACGAVAVFLPVDGGLCGGRRVLGTEVTLRVRPAEREDPPGTVSAALARRRSTADDALFVVLEADSDTPWAVVMHAVDEALAMGAYSFTFSSARITDREKPVAYWVERAAAGRTIYAADLLEPPNPDAPPRASVVAGARPGLFGFANVVTMVLEPVLRDGPDERRWHPVAEER